MVVLSDLVDNVEPVGAALAALAHRGHDIIVFQILDAAERDLAEGGPVILVDPETHRRLATHADEIREAYSRRVGEFVGRCERAMRKAGATSPR